MAALQRRLVVWRGLELFRVEVFVASLAGIGTRILCCIHRGGAAGAFFASFREKAGTAAISRNKVSVAPAGLT